MVSGPRLRAVAGLAATAVAAAVPVSSPRIVDPNVKSWARQVREASEGESEIVAALSPSGTWIG